MPKFKITFSFPEIDEIHEKFVFATEEELTEQIIPQYRDRLGFIIHEVAEAPTVYERQVLSCRLDSGQGVELRKFGFYLTYGDLIEGDPYQEYNEELVNSLKTQFTPDYIPTHVRRPSEDRIKGELPVFFGVAEWVRYGEEEKLGVSSISELRVVWFMDSVGEGLGFREMLQESLAGLDWDRFAKEFDAGDL
jgi:hypothetical protein